MGYLIETIYFLTAVVFIVGLKRMSHPTTARSGIVWAGYGMVLATLFSFAHPQIQAGPGNYVLMVIAMGMTVAVLFAGLFTMARGGEFSRKHSNKLMRWLPALAPRRNKGGR